MKKRTFRTTSLRALAQVLCISLAALASGCAYNDHQSIFDTKGPVASQQLDLTMLTLWVSVGIFVVVGSALVFALVRFRAPADLTPDSPLPPQTHGSVLLEGLLTAVSIGLLVVIATPTLATIFRLDKLPTPEEEPLIVTVKGYQWWWSFTYENASKRVVTANELRIPLGRKIDLRLESMDVIHSFWVPKLAGKTDVIPNQHNRMWLQADVQGIYWGQCAEYCGTSHANMRFRVATMYPTEFERWITAQDQPAVTPPKGSLAAEGMEIFMKGPKKGQGQACATCHAIKGTDAGGMVGPNLTHIASRMTLAAGILDNTDSDLKKWLHDPGSVKPGNRMATMAMPPLKLTDDEVNALAAYLETLK